MRWCLHLSEPLGAAENMALDEALMQRARTTGEHVMRVYAWSHPTLSLGRNQRAVGVFDRGLVEKDGVGIVRRLTGGRAVLHHREITYSVTGPAHRGDSVRASYGAINAILLAALQNIGVAASLAPPRSSGHFPPPGSAPCFELPEAGEIVFAGRKLVGSAQVREDGAFLQHGSILIDDDQPRVSQLSLVPIPHAERAATLREALGRAPSLHDVAESLFDAVRTRADAAACGLTLDVDLMLAAEAAQARYRDDLWTWRR